MIAISHNGDKLAAILGNPAMINAYKAGIPGNGKPFPDGAKMAKVHWNAKVNAAEPGAPTVPGTQHDVDFMVKDSKRFADSGGWGYGAFEYDAASDTFTARQLERQAAAGERRQVRVRVPHGSEDKRLRLHELRAQVKRFSGLLLLFLCTESDARRELGLRGLARNAGRQPVRLTVPSLSSVAPHGNRATMKSHVTSKPVVASRWVAAGRQNQAEHPRWVSRLVSSEG